uniref:Uncharacterized protein n=1 Tax=Pipistrellus kuhlii TaxID=59472 RepID=A0A7J7QYJ8_PIPKU|nr:hypothetical protein mPipKuh1_008124 [Pipistrellus kuhlii]
MFGPVLVNVGPFNVESQNRNVASVSLTVSITYSSGVPWKQWTTVVMSDSFLCDPAGDEEGPQHLRDLPVSTPLSLLSADLPVCSTIVNAACKCLLNFSTHHRIFKNIYRLILERTGGREK